ncbi:MAG TPA: FkbM family methyltransferase [Gammaproteobacteria bacterium]|nr:FkbM family methyltransferase [Gammaproteobacteria bacterium]
MKAYLKAAYVRVSRLLHHTPLSRVRWVASLHNWLYGRLSFGDRVSVGGFRLYVDPRDRTIAKKIALYGGYEPFLQGVLLRHAQAGTVVIDVGANVGLHTLPLAGKVGKSGRVIAFEPDPENHSLLLKNLQANGLLSRVTVYNVGLSDKGGGALLYQSAANRGGLSLRPRTLTPPSARPSLPSRFAWPSAMTCSESSPPSPWSRSTSKAPSRS